MRAQSVDRDELQSAIDRQLDVLELCRRDPDAYRQAAKVLSELFEGLHMMSDGRGFDHNWTARVHGRLVSAQRFASQAAAMRTGVMVPVDS